jgi:hypothetical protein
VIRELNGNATRIKGIVKSTATCNSDEFVSGGGFSINGSGIPISSHAADRKSWEVTAANLFSASGGELQAHAECAKMQ